MVFEAFNNVYTLFSSSKSVSCIKKGLLLLHFYLWTSKPRPGLAWDLYSCFCPRSQPKLIIYTFFWIFLLDVPQISGVFNLSSLSYKQIFDLCYKNHDKLGLLSHLGVLLPRILLKIVFKMPEIVFLNIFWAKIKKFLLAEPKNLVSTSTFSSLSLKNLV